MSDVPGATIVTGAGGVGCGRAIACRAAGQTGSPVIASDVNDVGGEETVRLIRDQGGEAVFYHADVRDADQVRQLVAFAQARYGRVAMVVNNASSPEPSREGLVGWAEALQTDLMGTLYVTQFAVEAMRRSGGGSILNMSSISALWHGRRTAGGFPGYDVAKAGVIRLTTGLADLATTDRIRVNCLAPGWIATGGALAYWQSLTPAEKLARGVPAKLLPPDEVADIVLRIASDGSLCGRVVLWWSEDEPRLIEWGDRGYREGVVYSRTPVAKPAANDGV